MPCVWVATAGLGAVHAPFLLLATLFSQTLLDARVDFGPPLDALSCVVDRGNDQVQPQRLLLQEKEPQGSLHRPFSRAPRDPQCSSVQGPAAEVQGALSF